jgi:50S ribosomal subunit-associated GTPase HflX
VVYDAASPESYTIVETLIKRYESACVLPKPFVVVVANKIDLLESQNQQRELEKLEDAHLELCLKSFLASAKTGESVPQIFDFVATEVRERAERSMFTESRNINGKKENSGGTCC